MNTIESQGDKLYSSAMKDLMTNEKDLLKVISGKMFMISLSARLMIVNQLLILLSELSSKNVKKRGELLVKVIVDADDFGMSEAINMALSKVMSMV